IDGPAEQPAAIQVSGDLVSLLSLELERRHGFNTAQRRGRARVLDRLARATVDDVVAARWLTSAGLPDADLRAAAIAAPDDADDLAADLLITLPAALVRVVGEVVELAVPLDTDLPGVLGTLAGRRASASRCGRVRWWSRSVKPARRCLPAGCKASTCTPRTSPAAGCCSTRLGRNPFRHTPMQYSGRRTRRIDRVSCYADSPRSWNTTGTGDQPPPRCRSTGTPCATASKRSND